MDQSFRVINGLIITSTLRKLDFTLIVDSISLTQDSKEVFVKNNISCYPIIFFLLWLINYILINDLASHLLIGLLTFLSGLITSSVLTPIHITNIDMVGVTPFLKDNQVIVFAWIHDFTTDH